MSVKQFNSVLNRRSETKVMNQNILGWFIGFFVIITVVMYALFMAICWHGSINQMQQKQIPKFVSLGRKELEVDLGGQQNERKNKIFPETNQIKQNAGMALKNGCENDNYLDKESSNCRNGDVSFSDQDLSSGKYNNNKQVSGNSKISTGDYNNDSDFSRGLLGSQILNNNNNNNNTNNGQFFPVESLVSKFAPIFHLHPKEKYLPCSVEWFLHRTKLVDQKTRHIFIQSGFLTKQNLLETQEQFPNFSMEIEINKKQDRYGIDADEINQKAPIYVHVKEVINEYDQIEAIEINYITFYAYNGEYPLFGSKLFAVGHHEGDWEHVTVRCDPRTGNLLGVWYNAHRSREGSWKPAEQVPVDKESGRLLVYVALHGHGTYPEPGIFHRIFFAANDQTSCEGLTWIPQQFILMQPYPRIGLSCIGPRGILQVKSRGFSIGIHGGTDILTNQQHISINTTDNNISLQLGTDSVTNQQQHVTPASAPSSQGQPLFAQGQGNDLISQEYDPSPWGQGQVLLDNGQVQSSQQEHNEQISRIYGTLAQEKKSSKVRNDVNGNFLNKYEIILIRDSCDWQNFLGSWGSVPGPCQQDWYHTAEQPVSRGYMKRVFSPLSEEVQRVHNHHFFR